MKWRSGGGEWTPIGTNLASYRGFFHARPPGYVYQLVELLEKPA